MIGPGFICPQPGVWHAVHTQLSKHVGPEVEGPPKPLILDGWWYSTDEDKRDRWAATVRWADEHNLGNLIPTIDDANGYRGETV